MILAAVSSDTLNGILFGDLWKDQNYYLKLVSSFLMLHTLERWKIRQWGAHKLEPYVPFQHMIES